ncbi:uncharacterized protein KY384_003032 [Bacidia gigantensis]|uniref:uncharacterized protein n=1 Tax=Bacidia gigantensis TaxID=2732470 RepID=UPI001D039128|nr:uncharacterized protein KY384_003032 [Bacidia gigantensis]KAG8531403.1 hypothetical protein KY384_003032 [Bacidia gigantensis]
MSGPRSPASDLLDGNLKHQHNGYNHASGRKLSEPIKLVDDSAVSDEPPDVKEIVAEAMQELMKIRQKEQSARPLRIARPHPAHQPDDILREQFQQLAEDELKIRRLNTRDWLRVATWWLLKARFNTKIDEDPLLFNSQASFSVSSNGKSAINQAYVDLLKASWILHNVILKDDNLSSLMTDENRTLFYHLSDGINEDFEDFQPVDAPEKTVLHGQNHNIWELLQPAEETYEEEGAFPGLENGRYVTVDKDDAGAESEKVLFRTFVDASIGRKTNRMRSKGAPYMLLLSTVEGESEPKVTLCNQSGTVCLTRDLTVDDLQIGDMPVNPFAGSKIMSKEAIPLDFDRLKVTVAFQNQEDFENFTFIPTAYFEAVKRREPRNLEKATETVLLSHSVEIFEHLEASTMKSLSPREVYQSCDLRVLETTSKAGWRTTRRLVVSSSAGEKKPWCIEVFLPLSRVQIRREGIARKLLVKWSDCAQKNVRSDGNYNKIHSYVYDDTNPNIGHSLLFRNAQDATDFERTVLHLSIPPIFNWTSGLNSALVYMISDTEPDPKNYKAIMVTRTRYDWKYSELYYLYRDIDYIYTRMDSSSVRISFPSLYYTDYISTHVDRLYKPDLGEPVPHFSHCEKKIGNSHLDFDNESAAMRFMSSLTSAHTLIFARRAHYITTKAPSRFSTSAKSNKGPPEIQLWLKGSNTRLVSRWGEKVEDKWLSMTVPRNGLEYKKDGSKASLQKCEFERGRKLDMANLMARDPRDKKEEGKRLGPINVGFESVRGEFSLSFCASLLYFWRTG